MTAYRGAYTVYDYGMQPTNYCAEEGNNPPTSLSEFLNVVSCLCATQPGIGIVASWQKCTGDSSSENWVAQAWYGWNCDSPEYWQDNWPWDGDYTTPCSTCTGGTVPAPCT